MGTDVDGGGSSPVAFLQLTLALIYLDGRNVHEQHICGSNSEQKQYTVSDRSLSSSLGVPGHYHTSLSQLWTLESSAWIRATGLAKRWVDKKAVKATTRVDNGKEEYPMKYIKPVVFGIQTYFSQVDA